MNERIFIECVKCGEVEVGPGIWHIIATVKFKNGEEEKWLTNIEVEGVPNFYLSDIDLYEKYINIDDCEALGEIIEKYQIDYYEGICLEGYEAIGRKVKENNDKSSTELIRCIVELSGCDKEKEKTIKLKYEKKYIGNNNLK